MVVTVEELLCKPFLNRPREEKIKIIREGKPRPVLVSLMAAKRNAELVAQQKPNDFPNTRAVVFDSTSYDQVDWLTGCNLRQALFCWSCLLFRVETDQWNRCGIRDLVDLNQKIDQHSKCISHIQSSLDMKLFLPEGGKGDPALPKVPEEVLRRNREIARRIIDSVCALVTERHTSENKNHLKPEDCIENLKLIRDYDIVQTSIVDDAIGLLSSSPEILDDVAASITEFMKASVQEDLEQSRFVSLILTEHSQEILESNISVVVRYLKGGEVCERFVEFVRTYEEKTCNLICKQMNKIIKEFRISRNLIAYSLDGSVFPDLEVFNRYVDFARGKEDLLSFSQPCACFVPCHFHRLDHLFHQVLFVYKACDVFFKNLAALRSYIRKGPRELFWTFIPANASQPESNADMFDSADRSKFLVFIRSHRKDCIRFLEYKLEQSSDQHDVAKLLGLCSFLRSFQTFFLLEALAEFFSPTFPLEEALYHDSSENVLDTYLINKVYSELMKGSYSEPETFEKYFQDIIESFEEAEKPVTKEATKEMNNKSFYRELYEVILKAITDQVKYRFLNHKKLPLFNAFNFKRKGQNVNANYVREVTLAYDSCLDYANLEKEMTSLENNEAVLNSESLHQMMKVFLKDGLKDSCPNLYKLMELVLTLPCSLPNSNGGPSKLADLAAWSGLEHENISDLSLMCVEHNYLMELKKSFSFHDEVMVRFQERNKSLQLLEM